MLRMPKPDKRRPVVVLSRQSLLDALHTATVIAVTSTLRDSPTEVPLGPEHGLKGASCANLTNLFTVSQSELHAYVGSVGPRKLGEICAALAIASGCD